MIKNELLKGAHSLAMEIRIRERKLREGPGMTGMMLPTIPRMARSSPMMMSRVVTLLYPKRNAPIFP